MRLAPQDIPKKIYKSGKQSGSAQTQVYIQLLLIIILAMLSKQSLADPLALQSQSTYSQSTQSQSNYHQGVSQYQSVEPSQYITANNGIYLEFSFFDAQTYLIDDFDGDQYYRTFSIVFDADLYSYSGELTAEVYADIYISANNETWEYLHSTDNFFITGDSADDSYEVITTLSSGYPSGHYDILIELFHVGTNGPVASFSAYDTNSLYALPLESAEFDQVYEEVYIEHGGSLPLAAIILMLTIVIVKSRSLLIKRK
ncbi:choice-of-anchor H family protein [Thalassotalea sp. PLHSN55]|uniref:choice-of-anchor H family protein n=1 Tax=Thalassotalea sp. PLHSN55 TaxID=3435888 RepID=UPI003F82ECF4